MNLTLDPICGVVESSQTPSRGIEEAKCPRQPQILRLRALPGHRRFSKRIRWAAN